MVVEYDIEVDASNEAIVVVLFVVDIDEVYEDVVSVVEMYGVDEEFMVGSKKGIRELTGVMIEGDSVGCVRVVKDIAVLNVLTNVGSSVEISTGEEGISMYVDYSTSSVVTLGLELENVESWNGIIDAKLEEVVKGWL